MVELASAHQGHRFLAVPICHYRMEYAAWVRFEVERYSPDCIAVELPSTVREPVLTAIGRLPYLSVVLYEDAAGHAIYLPIEPCDGVCEALRSGLERRLSVHLVDLDVDEYPLHPEPMPDPYSVKRLGLAPVYRAFRQYASPPSGPLDLRREQHMAYWLKHLTGQYERVLFVCGMAHLPGVVAQMGHSDIRPAARMHREGVRVFNLHAESAREVMGEQPLVSAVYERWRSGARPVAWPGQDEEAAALASEPAPLRALDDRPPARPPRMPEKPDPEDQNDRNLLELLRRVFTEAGRPELRTVRRKPGTEPESVAPRPSEPAPGPLSAGGGPGELRRLLRVLEGHKDSKHPMAPVAPAARSFDVYDRLLPEGPPAAGPLLDRQQILLGLLREARSAYRRSTRDEVRPWQARTLMRFLRRYCTLEGRLLPDFYQTLVGARACVDDNYAYEVWQLGSDYPFVDDSGKFATLEVKGEELWLGMRRLRFRRRIPDRSRRPRPFPVRRRRREKHAGEWKERFRFGGICSYPPEDLIVENFGDFLKKKAGKILSEERSRVEPFSTSLLDGVDMRETVRNWHNGRKLFVRENGRVAGSVGAVVLVFDEDRSGDRFPWTVTWWGEHEQESDLAFYATAATAQVVGPGIARCQYGGFLMTHPPGRLYDVWEDPLYDAAEGRAERLLLAAVDYSLEKYVVYVAPRPPRSRLVAQARRMDKKIVFVPLGVLSPVTLKRLRVFHVLSDHAVRVIAKDYIF